MNKNEFEVTNIVQVNNRLSSAQLKVPRNYKFDELIRSSQITESGDEANENRDMSGEPLTEKQILENKRSNAKMSFYGASEYLEVMKQKNVDIHTSILFYSTKNNLN